MEKLIRHKEVPTFSMPLRRGKSPHPEPETINKGFPHEKQVNRTIQTGSL